MRLRGQGELRHQQQVAHEVCVRLKFVWLASVREYPVLKQAVDQPQGGRLVVGWAHPHQNQGGRGLPEATR